MTTPLQGVDHRFKPGWAHINPLQTWIGGTDQHYLIAQTLIRVWVDRTDAPLVAVGIVIMLMGVPMIGSGLMVYVTASEAEDETDETLEEMGLEDIPGMDLEAPKMFGISVAVAGAVTVAVGVAILLVGMSKKEKTHALEAIPASDSRYCQYCGQRISTKTVRCPSCGRTINP